MGSLTLGGQRVSRFRLVGRVGRLRGGDCGQRWLGRIRPRATALLLIELAKLICRASGMCKRKGSGAAHPRRRVSKA